MPKILMTPGEYKQAALRTENTPNFIYKHRAVLDGGDGAAKHQADLRLSRIMHAILGMITELGELCDPVKRHLIYNTQLDTQNMIEEMGDREWYSSGVMMDALEAKLEDIWERNINKLRSRFPHKFTEEAAVNRDLAAEKRALARGDEQDKDALIEQLQARLAEECQISAVRLTQLNELRGKIAVFAANHGA